MLFHEHKLYICLWRVLQIMTRFNMYVLYMSVFTILTEKLF